MALWCIPPPQHILHSCVCAPFFDSFCVFICTLKNFAGEPNDLKLLEFVLKCSDISNIVKPFHIGKQWAVRVTTEFFAQGAKELELGLPLTPMCDSQKSRVSSQIGFSQYVARGCFSALVRIFPSLGVLISNLDENDKIWPQYDDTRLLAEVPLPEWS